MIVVRRRCWKLTAILAMLLLAPSVAMAEAWMDDFNDGNITDGNPVTWITDVDGFFPGSYDASSGDLVMTPAADPSAGNQTSGFVNVPFADTYVRTQGIVMPDPDDPDNDEGNLVVLARVDPTTLSGYLLYFDVSSNLNIQSLLFGVSADIGVGFTAPFNAGSEVIIELNVVGSQLSGYVWAADDPAGKPATPQVTVTDATFTTGVAGIAFAEDEDGTFGIFRHAAAQDTPFVEASRGDFDGDSDVDGEDFLIWQRGLGLTGQPNASTGDGDGDGDVDADDRGAWQENFGRSSAAAAVGAVAEPATICCSGVAILALAPFRRRHL